MTDALARCPWAEGSDAMRLYHDREWGVPQHDDRVLFEFLTLEGAQAGLSWSTVLVRRDAYRRAFVDWDIEKVAAFGEGDVERLLAAPSTSSGQAPGIIRNRAKVLSAIANARVALAVQQDFGSLDAYLWRFVGGEPIVRGFASMSELPAETEESRLMSRELRMRGFGFVGPTICYAFMQATGMVNDHLPSCFRYRVAGAR